jgi:hypothetical protein
MAYLFFPCDTQDIFREHHLQIGIFSRNILRTPLQNMYVCTVIIGTLWKIGISKPLHTLKFGSPAGSDKIMARPPPQNLAPLRRAIYWADWPDK